MNGNLCDYDYHHYELISYPEIVYQNYHALFGNKIYK